MLFWQELLKKGLQEDHWENDWTAIGATRQSLSRSGVTAKIFAKSDGIWAASDLLKVAEKFSGELGSPVRIKIKVKDGSRLKPGLCVAELRGPAKSILALERPLLNLASYAGGIATQTRALVDQVAAAWKKNKKNQFLCPRVTLTRKTLPNYRDLCIHSVRVGGGYPHRMSLGSSVLIKENHIKISKSITRAVEGAKNVAPHLSKIEVEVRNFSELQQALKVGVDVVMLDNFSPQDVAKAVRTVSTVKEKPLIEISGGIQLLNIQNYVLPGVDVISVGSITHSVKSIDLSLLF